MNLNEFLDCHYGDDGDNQLRKRLKNGADVNRADGPQAETPLHVATRRFRTSAVKILLEYGADIDATTANGKTAFAHAVRRRFSELASVLQYKGAKTELLPVDQFAVAVVNGRMDRARNILAENPSVVRTENSEENRLLADVAGRNDTEPVVFLIDNGADLSAPGLDGGTPLHQAAWFGQPANAKLLIAAGAPLDVFDPTHQSSPIGWAVHGSRYSGGAEVRRNVYIELVQMLLDAGSSLHYPDQPESDTYRVRLQQDAAPEIGKLLKQNS